MRGTFSSVTGSSVRSAAARIGSAAFLLPAGRMVPASLCPPWTMYRSALMCLMCRGAKDGHSLTAASSAGSSNYGPQDGPVARPGLLDVAAIGTYDATSFRRPVPMLETVALISAIAGALLKIALLALVVAAMPVVWGFRKTSGKLNDVVDSLRRDISPALSHASAALQNVEAMTSTLRGEAQTTSRTVAEANDRMRQGMRLMER